MRRNVLFPVFVVLSSCLSAGAFAQSMPGAPPAPTGSSGWATSEAPSSSDPTSRADRGMDAEAVPEPSLAQRDAAMGAPASGALIVPDSTAMGAGSSTWNPSASAMGAAPAWGSASGDWSRWQGHGEASTMVNGQPNVDPAAASILARSRAERYGASRSSM